MAIIALLALLVLPTYRGYVQKSRKAGCAANLRTLYTASMSWSADHNNHILLGHDSAGTFGPVNRGWIQALKPYLNQTDNAEVTKVFTSPGNPVPNVRGYGMNHELRARRPGSSIFITPRTSYRMNQIAMPSKLMIMGNSQRPNSNWMNLTPTDAEIVGAIPDDWFGDGTANFLFLDGHVEAIKRTDLLQGGARHDIFHGAIPDYYLNAAL